MNDRSDLYFGISLVITLLILLIISEFAERKVKNDASRITNKEYLDAKHTIELYESVNFSTDSIKTLN